MINKWLDEFKAAWSSKDIDKVLSLYADDVEYWENPYVRLENKSRIREEWSAILQQSNIDLNLEVYSSADNKYSVIWKLSYMNASSIQQDWAGTYLMTLDLSGKCTYFHQTGETR